MSKEKFVQVDSRSHHLRIAVGLEFPQLPTGVTLGVAGVAEIRPNNKRSSQEVYLNLAGVEPRPQKIEVQVPEALNSAPWGQILLNNNRTGAQVLFGRKGEDKPFSFNQTDGKYIIPLRLYKESEHPFNPVYVRVDKGDETYFFLIKARWADDMIAIEIEKDPKGIPDFLE